MDDVVPIAGELASIQVPDTGRAEFNCVSQRMKVSDLIGRSLTVDSTNTGYVSVFVQCFNTFIVFLQGWVLCSYCQVSWSVSKL